MDLQNILLIVAGFVLLFFGRRFFWLLVRASEFSKSRRHAPFQSHVTPMASVVVCVCVSSCVAYSLRVMPALHSF